MTTVTLPPDLESRLLDEASRRGTTPELLAVDSLRRRFPSRPAETIPAEVRPAATLYDFLAGYIGTVEGTGEPVSRDCDRRFSDALVEDLERKRKGQQRRGS
jgi:hypothetical protein